MADALTAADGDLAGFAANPAALPTLARGQAILQYQKGFLDDAQGQAALGGPGGRSYGWGAAVSFYDGGQADIMEAGARRSVAAQRDLSVSLGAGRQFGPLAAGASFKYLRSELAERYTADAYAVDLGVAGAVRPGTRLGLSVRNLGSGIRYRSESDSLPRSVTAGVSHRLGTRVPVTIFFDLPYAIAQRTMAPALGVEGVVGLLALRAGYKGEPGRRQFSLGTGIGLGRSSIDYAFGMARGLDAEHRLSLSMSFGDGRPSPVVVAPAPVVKRAVVQRPTLESPAPSARGEKARRVYIVRSGDSLASIARARYGDARQWRSIYLANRHLINDPANLKEGTRIVLP